ncbi:MAG: TauD/TfdA family dioxygenase [Rubrivivax sp.]|nr:TauD/TfdA family dioxygenase [Rubrivivax sp.]
MTAPSLRSIETPGSGHAFDLDDDVAYRAWRGWKLQHRPADAAAITVDVVDPCALSVGERDLLLSHIAHANMALYRSPPGDDDRDMPRRLGAQLGLQRLDANWLADEDGISSIQVSSASDGRGGFIPYTQQAIRWHTDGYYHPSHRRIHGMLLHCVRPAARGGVNRLLDPELVYIALRDESPALVRALMRPDAMTIPARQGDDGEARAAQSGPVFSVDQGALHMRYTARTRSIEWHADALVQAAAARLADLLNTELPGLLSVGLQAGMGVVGHNVLHDRSAFVDDPAQPRLLYRARFLDRATAA